MVGKGGRFGPSDFFGSRRRRDDFRRFFSEIAEIVSKSLHFPFQPPFLRILRDHPILYETPFHVRYSIFFPGSGIGPDPYFHTIGVPPPAADPRGVPLRRPGDGSALRPPRGSQPVAVSQELIYEEKHAGKYFALFFFRISKNIGSIRFLICVIFFPRYIFLLCAFWDSMWEKGAVLKESIFILPIYIV